MVAVLLILTIPLSLFTLDGLPHFLAPLFMRATRGWMAFTRAGFPDWSDP